ncbi:MAG: hypothetical protein U9Q12_02590 [Patescibacteria group bacterium]|nr:hypothetical protein [Patescibacteria group bacterium]
MRSKNNLGDFIMKLMIIDSSIFGEALKTILEQHVNVILSSHEDALETFLFEEPDRILICECWQDSDGKTANVSSRTTEDIHNSADETVIVKTIGFDGEAFGGTCDIPMVPLTLESLLQSLNIGSEL